ncbi:hypothetical protein F2P81_023834 [Scophthalmus maximus]|uniref:Uncharacterized protein n=1 Tax=Scophthalmus maximus TaxID=52904 RepID=A0A6A4RXL2_SCOMX|nr:hypothetical protein F2P81_023834 [Scophthalmus maximus]
MRSGINWTCLWLDLWHRIYIAALSLPLCVSALLANGVLLQPMNIIRAIGSDCRAEGQCRRTYFSKYCNGITFIVSTRDPLVDVGSVRLLFIRPALLFVALKRVARPVAANLIRALQKRAEQYRKSRVTTLDCEILLLSFLSAR